MALTFVLCVENNGIRAQALLLCQSIRRFGGRYASAPIIAVSPRPELGLGIDAATRRALEDLQVEYVEEPLNSVCPQYGSANRVFSAAWAESRVRTDWVVVLDSDTVFFDEIALPGDDVDLAVRPVDVQGCATQGPADPREDYWRRLAALQHIPVTALPFVQTTDGGHCVRASYNGGLVVARREAGILQAWADLFQRSIAADVKPWRGSFDNVYASTGYVGSDATALWGSNQAALAVAAWSVTRRVVLYGDTYNVPLHLLMERPTVALSTRLRARPHGAGLVHVHYHWTFMEPRHESAMATLREFGVGQDRLDWLVDRLPLTGAAG